MEHLSTAHGTPDASGAKCPVDHSAPVQRAAIPSSALPVVRMARIRQVLSIWANPEPFLRAQAAKYGDRFRVGIIPGIPIYVISNPDDIKQLFAAPRDHVHTGTSNAPIEKWTGQQGLAYLDEDKHTTRRKAVMPGFRGGALKRIERKVPALATETVDRLMAAGDVVSVHPHAHRYTTRVIFEVIFGDHRPSNEAEMFGEVIEMLKFNSRPATMKMFHLMTPWQLRRMRLNRVNGVDNFLKRKAKVYGLIDEAIEERRRSGLSGDDLLSVMLGIKNEDGTGATNAEMRDEMMTQFLAGTETTAAAICWALEFLTRTPDVLQRLIAEIDEGTSDEYITAVMQEVLRLGPPILQIVPRAIVKPIELGGVRYEAQDRLWCSAYLLSRDPNLYPEPDAFRPERWLTMKPASHTFIPFGGGHTRCLGDRVAYIELKATLTEIFTRCEVLRADPKPETAHSRTVVNIPRKGARMIFRPRKVNAELVAG